MFLSDVDIVNALKTGEITIEPFNKDHLSVASYDVTLDNEFEVIDRPNTTAIDPAKKIYPSTRKLIVPDGEAFTLHPGENVLGKQREYIGADNKHLILLSGKSSLARAGLVVHNTAMLFNPGHYFHPTFELVNTNNVPIILRPGMQIAQLLFAELKSPVSRPYNEVGRYDEQNSNHFTPPKEDK